MSQEQAEQLIAFVAALPAPRQAIPTDGEKAKASSGASPPSSDRLCGLPVQDCPQGIYGDLLLHDMGRSGRCVSAVSAKQHLLRAKGKSTPISTPPALKSCSRNGGLRRCGRA